MVIYFSGGGDINGIFGVYLVSDCADGNNGA